MRKFPVTPAPAEEDGGINYTISGGLTSYTGATLVIGDTVFLSVDGVQVLAGQEGQFDAVHAYTFVDAAHQEIGGAYARDDDGQNIVGLRVVDQAGAGDDTTLYLHSIAGESATAALNIGAQIEGLANDTYIAMEKYGSTKSEIDLMTGAAVGRVRIFPKLQLLGAGYALCDLYIKGTNLIIKYQDGATTRYKYLDLSGTGTAWQHATAEP